MADVKFQRGTEAKIKSTETANGTLSFATDTKKIFLDTASDRIEFGGGNGGAGIIPCSLSDNNHIKFNIDGPEANTIIVGCLTDMGSAYTCSYTDPIYIDFNSGPAFTLDCNKYTAGNFELYSVFAILRTDEGCVNLGTLNAIDDGIV